MINLQINYVCVSNPQLSVYTLFSTMCVLTSYSQLCADKMLFIRFYGLENFASIGDFRMLLGGRRQPSPHVEFVNVRPTLTMIDFSTVP